MKIAFVIINANRHEGTSRAVLEVAERLAVDHKVDLWARTAEEAATRKLNWIRVPGFRRPEVVDFATFKWQVDRSLRHADYDIVHSAGPNTAMADVYSIQTVHPVKMEQVASFRAAASAGWARRISWQLYDQQVVKAERQAYRLMGPRGPRAFLPVSKGTKLELLCNYPQVCSATDESNVVVVPNGADLDLFTPANRAAHRNSVRKEYGFADDDFVLIFAGGDWRRKGLDLALIALTKIESPKVKLLVVGRDRAGDDVKSLSGELGLQRRVAFAGFRRDVHRYYSAGDLFLFPTSYEAFSVATIEAAASGLPVLMPNVSGAEELIGSANTGALIRRDPEHIAEVVMRFVQSPDLVQQTSISARQLVEREFSWDSIAKRTLETYSKLIEQRKLVQRSAGNTKVGFAQ